MTRDWRSEYEGGFGSHYCPLQNLREDRALASDTRITGIVWVIFLSYNWLTVTLNQFSTQTTPEIKSLNASAQSSRSFCGGQLVHLRYHPTSYPTPFLKTYVYQKGQRLDIITPCIWYIPTIETNVNPGRYHYHLFKGPVECFSLIPTFDLPAWQTLKQPTLVTMC